MLTLRRRYILIWMYLIARTYVSGCLSAGVDTCCSNSQWISKLLAIPFHSGRGGGGGGEGGGGGDAGTLSLPINLFVDLCDSHTVVAEEVPIG